MNLVVKKKAVNCKERQQDIINGYKSVGKKLSADNQELLKNYSLLLELDEALYKAYYERSKAEAGKRGFSDKEKLLFQEIEAFARSIERKLGVSDLIAADAQLAILRRQLVEASQEAGKVYMKVHLSDQASKGVKRSNKVQESSQILEPENKKTKTEDKALQWNHITSWNKEHIDTVFDAAELSSSQTSSLNALKTEFLKRHNISISNKVANYLLIHYGIRRFKVDAPEFRNTFDKACELFEHDSPQKKVNEIADYINAKLSLNLSKNMASSGVMFRNMIQRSYGSTTEPESNITYSEERLAKLGSTFKTTSINESKLDAETDFEETQVAQSITSHDIVNISTQGNAAAIPKAVSVINVDKNANEVINNSNNGDHSLVSTLKDNNGNSSFSKNSKKASFRKTNPSGNIVELIKSVAKKYEDHDKFLEKTMNHLTEIDQSISKELIISVLDSNLKKFTNNKSNNTI